jgi:hypothetical protein
MTTAEVEYIPVDEVVFREDLYPRVKRDPALVQKYAADLSVLPAIEVNQNRELIDGWHRWTAHKSNEAETIGVFTTPTSSDLHLLALASKRNATFGWQMDVASKKQTAIQLYQRGAGYLPEHSARVDENGEKEGDAARHARIKADIAAHVGASERMVQSYLADIDKDLREQRSARIFSLWLQCWTQAEIAKDVEVEETSKEVRVSGEIEEIRKYQKLPDDRTGERAYREATYGDEDWAPPLYDVWNAGKNANEVKHFGNTPVEFVDRLLYLYTNPFDVVIDPFAGGGSTIDVCQKRLRRYWVSDRKPIASRESEIRQHDLATDGISGPSRWADVALVYMDPPYWKQAAGKYSTDDTDLANMPLEQFTETLVGIIHDYGAKLKPGAHVACIISPTQWPNEDKSTVYHDLDLARLVGKKLRLKQRILCPYSSEQYNGTQVDIAKDRKLLMAITRTMLVWERE